MDTESNTNQPEVRLRPAREQDEGRITQLVRSERLNPTGLNWEHFLVLEGPDGSVVGCGQIKPHGDGTLELASLVVVEARRGRGLGRRLIEALLDGVGQPVWLMCRSSLTPLYRRFGFEEVATDEAQPAYFQRVRRLVGVYHFLRGTGEYLAVMCRPAERDSSTA